jgi:hypothetical protein
MKKFVIVDQTMDRSESGETRYYTQFLTADGGWTEFHWKAKKFATQVEALEERRARPDGRGLNVIKEW